MDSLAFLKPVLTALLLPPTSLILLLIVAVGVMAGSAGGRPRASRRHFGLGLALLVGTGLWLSATQGFSRLLMNHALKPPAALSSVEREQLASEVRSRPGSHAILVLGGGRIPLAPEYGEAELTSASLERLRYGVFLSRETGIPLAFSGGVGWGQEATGPAEAEIAARLARQHFGQPLRWVEKGSRDTRENAAHSIELLRQAGVRHILLVTHAWHMPRALRFFRAAAGPEIAIEPAAMGYFVPHGPLLFDWLPSSEGVQQTRWALRELLALLIQR